MKVSFVLLFCFVALPVLSQGLLNLTNNSIHAGDSITLEKVDYTQPGDGGNGAVWDFSGLETIGHSYIKYACISDSSIAGYTPVGSYKYEIENNHIMLTGYESRMHSLDYRPYQTVLPLPLQYGQTIAKSYHGEGRYCGTHYERILGNVKITADGEGTLILSESDTLCNTLRVYTLNTMSVRLNADSCKNDSDNLKQVVTERYQWFARGFRYPLFETVTSSTFDNLNHVATTQYAYRCPPEIQILLNDTINERIRNSDKSNYQGVITNHSSSEDIDKSNSNRFDYEIVVNRNQISINYDVSEASTIHAMIVDVLGNVEYHTQQITPAGSGYTLNLDSSNLRRGQYIIYINVNGTIYNAKIPIK